MNPHEETQIVRDYLDENQGYCAHCTIPDWAPVKLAFIGIIELTDIEGCKRKLIQVQCPSCAHVSFFDYQTIFETDMNNQKADD